MTTTTINIVGYSIALSACLIIGLFVYRQSTFDHFNEDVNRIYRFNSNLKGDDSYSATSNHQWREVLLKEIPGIEKAARFGWNFEQDIECEKKQYKAEGASGDKELFDIFSFPVLEKEEENFFEKPLSMAVSKSLATRIFGNESPIGKTLKLNYGKEYTITALFEDIPVNSSLQFEFLTNLNDEIIASGEQMAKHWTWWWLRTFVVVKDAWVVEGFTNNMKPLQSKYVGDWYAENRDYYLQPLKEIHLHSAEIMGSFNTDISITLITIFCSAGLLILIISCINFINLSIAGFESRKKTVAIKKIIGASRIYLFRQYISYSMLLTFLCILLGIFISIYAIPVLKSQGIKGIDIPYGNPVFWILILMFGLFIGLLSGLYPANYISKTITMTSPQTFKPRSWFRNGLITIQFTIAMVLLIASAVIKKQLNESTKGNLGYGYSSLITFWSTTGTFDHYKAFKEEISKVPGVLGITSSNFPLPGHLGNYWPVQVEGSEKLDIFHAGVSANFFNVLHIPIRNQLGELREDTSRTADFAVVNEEAVKQFNIGDRIVSKTYMLGENKVEVAGIMNNFHIGSLRDRIQPVQFTLFEKGWNNIIRIEETNREKILADIRLVWEKFEQERPFEYHFLEDLITEQYGKEESLLKLFNLFFGLAILISLIGLFGLVQLLLRFRVKEIGIRKVNGARALQVVTLLNKDFMKWVFFAFVIACPVAWYIMHKWLENFAYKTNLNWWVFAVAGIMAMAVALLTVSWQCWRAASRNPVEALRYE